MNENLNNPRKKHEEIKTPPDELQGRQQPKETVQNEEKLTFTPKPPLDRSTEIRNAEAKLEELVQPMRMEKEEQLIDDVRKFKSARISYSRWAHTYTLHPPELPKQFNDSLTISSISSRTKQLVEESTGTNYALNLGKLVTRENVSEIVTLTPTREIAPRKSSGLFAKMKHLFKKEEDVYRYFNVMDIYPNEKGSQLYDLSYVICGIPSDEGKLVYANTKTIAAELKLPRELAVKLLNTIKENPQLIRTLITTIVANDCNPYEKDDEQIQLPNFNKLDNLGSKLMIIDRNKEMTMKAFNEPDAAKSTSETPTPKIPGPSDPEVIQPLPPPLKSRSAKKEISPKPSLQIGNLIQFSPNERYLIIETNSDGFGLISLEDLEAGRKKPSLYLTKEKITSMLQDNQATITSGQEAQNIFEKWEKPDSSRHHKPPQSQSQRKDQ